MKFSIEVHNVKIRKSVKFKPCNLNGYRDMDVTNLNQNPVIFSERGHLEISQGSIYLNNLSLACYNFKENNKILKIMSLCQKF